MFEVFKVWWISSGHHLAVQHPTSYKWNLLQVEPFFFPLFPHGFLPLKRRRTKKDLHSFVAKRSFQRLGLRVRRTIGNSKGI